uniref:CHORD domain-containing protein n=1 Tax=Panagrellus redivivus TaxID=6233 RepID=A0A7E4VG52_PANRE
MAQLQCYNKGCSQKYDPEDSDKEVCQYHPGPHEFHDAYKIWKCCQKKSTDFTTWLNYPGCQKGKHNNVKPVENVKVAPTQEIRPEKEDEVIVWNGLNKPAERHAPGQMESLNIEVTNGAAAAIERQQAATAEESGDNNVVVGAVCKNNACNTTYNGPETNKTECRHHPGTAIFHEGVKYWSCCVKKTSDFTQFLNQPGCEVGTHVWSKQNERVDKIREDWFSRAGYIHLNVYCKGALPDKSAFETDGLLLRTTIVHGFGNKITEASYDLFGAIVPSESKVIVGERKIEMVLKQAEPMGWPSLIFVNNVEEQDANVENEVSA